jgi:tRNA (guanine37-N1)-methyltransferase
MRFDVITLFPELFAPFVEAGITRRAYASGQIELKLWNPRDWAEGNYRRVDDRPFGGGPGMVMLAEPLARCLQAAPTAPRRPSCRRRPCCSRRWASRCGTRACRPGRAGAPS